MELKEVYKHAVNEDLEKLSLDEMKNFCNRIIIAIGQIVLDEQVKNNGVLDDVNEPFYCDIIEGEEGYKCKEQCMLCRSIEDELIKQ